MIPILDNEQIDVIHGTYFKNWGAIKQNGLSRMKRNHIHFSEGLPDDKSVISGMRQNIEILIYINLKLAILQGLKFYKSVNKVILSSGDANGFIRPKYFLKVCDNKGQIVEF